MADSAAENSIDASFMDPAVVARMDNLALAEQPHGFSFFLRPMKQLRLSFSAKGDPA